MQFAGFDFYIQTLLDWVSGLPSALVWFFFAFSNFTENVFPPWPGDTVTAFGGFLLARGALNFWELVSSTLVGNLAGAWVMYAFGHKLLDWLKNKNFPFKSELYNEESIQKTLDWFSRNGLVVVIFSRFSAGIRFFVSIVAGMVEMRPLWFFSAFTLAVTIWCGILIYGGFYLGSHWEKLLEFLALYNKIFTGFFVTVVLGFIIYKKFFERKKEA